MKALDYGLLADTLDLETIANSAAVDVKGSSIILQDVVTNAVQKYLKESLKQIGDKKRVKKSCSGKNVTELRNKIIKEFLRDKLSYKAKKCIHCGSPRRSVRIEYNSKIYLKALSSRQASNWESVSRLSKSNPNTSAVRMSVSNEDVSNVGLEEEEYSDDELTGNIPLRTYYVSTLYSSTDRKNFTLACTFGIITGEFVKALEFSMVSVFKARNNSWSIDSHQKKIC